MKKQFLFLITMMLLSATSAFAQGGTTGPLTWKIENDTLTISGRGEMPDYDFPIEPVAPIAPWFYYSFSTAIIENGVTSVGKNAFAVSFKLKTISISNTVTKIKDGAFDYSGLSSIVIPNSVTTIGHCAFRECGALTSITLPNKAIDFGDGVFWRCTRLTSITNLNSTPQAISPYLFYELDISACTLYVLKSSVLAYRHAEVWKEFNIVGINVGNEELEITNYELRVYPNPATGACSITLPDEFLYESALTLSVYDASGKLVQQIAMDNSGEIPQLRMGLEAKGVYVVVVSNGRKEYKGKVVFN